MGKREMEGRDSVYKGEDEESSGEDKGRNEGEKRRKGWIVGGDFNARTRGKGALEEGEEGKERLSKDRLINKQGEELVKWVGEEGWYNE